MAIQPVTNYFNDSGTNIKADAILTVNFTTHAIMCDVFIY